MTKRFKLWPLKKALAQAALFWSLWKAARATERAAALMRAHTEKATWLTRPSSKGVGSQFDSDYVFHKGSRERSDSRPRDAVLFDAYREHDDRGFGLGVSAQEALDDELTNIERYDRQDQGGDHGHDY